MTTKNLAAPLVVKTVDALCDGGQCGGNITLTTDVIFAAYAVVTETEGGYSEADTDLVLRDPIADTITVTCPALQMHSDRTCDGSATFTREMLNEGEWVAATPVVVAYMHKMDVA